MNGKSDLQTDALLLPPLRDYQKAVLTSQAVDDVTISAPQLGKTAVGALRVLVWAWYHGEDSRPWLIAAPTHWQAQNAMRQFCGFARSARILDKATMTPPLRAYLTNGAIVEGRSWERPEGMYGPSYLGGMVDEFGDLTAEGYSAISSRRAETTSQGYGMFCYLGNVRGLGGPAEKIWNLAVSGAPGFAYRRWTWEDRARSHDCLCGLGIELESADAHFPLCERGRYCRHIAREQQRMSTPQFRQLYGAEWVDYTDLPVYTFDRLVHEDASLAYQPELPLEIACDFNVDPMAWVIGQHKQEQAWALEEISIPGGATTEAACREVIRRYPQQKTHVEVYGDASGKARKTSASATDYDIIRQMLGSYYYSLQMRVPGANPPVIDRINSVNAMLRSASGAVRYRVHPSCTGLTKDLARVSYRSGTRDIDKAKDRTLTHFTDAEGYRLTTLFPVCGPSVIAVGVGPEDGRMADSMLTMEF